jgi:hypothetical protein
MSEMGCYRQLWGMANARLGVTGAIMSTSYRQPWRVAGESHPRPRLFPWFIHSSLLHVADVIDTPLAQA